MVITQPVSKTVRINLQYPIENSQLATVHHLAPPMLEPGLKNPATTVIKAKSLHPPSYQMDLVATIIVLTFTF